ncbi:MAG: exodeoxyribonuclease VII large subunit [Pseudomonadaceae bacterium]|nr:exodeoxyribonuclease VII large subunit [Pseudomonadaceae bacterium]
MGDLFAHADALEARPVVAEAPPVLTVGMVADLIRDVVEGSFPRVVVQGELSGWRCHAASGHWYGQLKDDSAVLDVVMWRGVAGRMKGIPATGEAAQLTGRLTTYRNKSTYQLQIERIEPAGLGALMQRLEALRAKLEAEGLFEEARKRELPLLPKVVGIVTSPTGAVIRDMLQRIGARCPTRVVVWPAAVQGANAAAELVAGIEGFNRLQGEARPDVLIVARGGGSVEDLMPFNDEVVVRAVAASGIPVISAVGHEPDVSLCDYAADYRAATPTAAAERVVPVRAELLAQLAGTQGWMVQRMGEMLERHAVRLAHVRRLLPDPMRLVVQARQRLDEQSDRLAHALPQRLAVARDKLEGLERMLAAQHPHKPLERGFALVRDAAGAVVSSARAPAGEIVLEFADGKRKGTLA